VFLDSMYLVNIRCDFGGKAMVMGLRCPKFAACFRLAFLVNQRSDDKKR